METPKLNELAAACYNGACNPKGLLRSLGLATDEVAAINPRESLELKYIIGHISYLLGEALGPSGETCCAMMEKMESKASV